MAFLHARGFGFIAAGDARLHFVNAPRDVRQGDYPLRVGDAVTFEKDDIDMRNRARVIRRQADSFRPAFANLAQADSPADRR